MIQEKPLRFACDRCHAQKLRCPRSVDPDKNRPDEPCSRCRKADVPCVVSERGKVGRPAKVTKRKTSPGLSHSSRSSISTSYDRCSSMPPSMGVAQATIVPDPVFFTPRSSPVPGYSPPSRDVTPMLSRAGTPMMGDEYGGFYDASSIIMTPMPHLNEAVFGMPSTGSDDGHDLGSWASHSNWSDTTSHPTPGLPDAIPYRMDFGMNLDLTSTPYNGAMLDVSDMPTYLNKDPSAALFEQASLHARLPKGTPPTSSPMPSAMQSNNAHYYKLTALNSKILQFLETYRNMPMLDDATSMNQITKEVVEFSGELIDVARQVMPGNASITAVQLGLGIDSGASDSSSVPSLMQSIEDGMSSRASSVDHLSIYDNSDISAIPQSAVIFLLLGCYTQLLHSFEFTVYSLHKRHVGGGAPLDMFKHPEGIDGLLKASLVIHTVTYLLDCVHRAFSGVQPEAPDFAGFADLGQCSAWKTFFWGQAGADAFSKDGLLAQAFVEISEREQSVLSKAQQLKQAISRFHI